MKLTKRGKRVRALAILAGVILAIMAGQFFTTHHRINYNCHQVAEGYLCDMKWEINK